MVQTFRIENKATTSDKTMAGHSKYANIKHRKNAQDAKRAKKFNKLAREISVAVRVGGGEDPEFNPRLRSAISSAKSDNMPNDRIDRAIQAGLGIVGDEANYEEIRYEGYGPGGVAVIVEALTDNRNRSASEIRTAFAKYGGSMGETGSVSYMFDRVGRIRYPATVAGETEMLEAAIEMGAQNLKTEKTRHTIITSVDDFVDVLSAMEKKFGQPAASGLAWIPQTPATPAGDVDDTLTTMLEVLDDLDDVQKIYMNYEMENNPLEQSEESA